MYFTSYIGIICSDNITRQNLNKKPSATTTIVDDDDQFFNKIKLKINKNLLLYEKFYYFKMLCFDYNFYTVFINLDIVRKIINQV